MENPDLYQFSDYRAFLQAYAAEEARLKPQWSLGKWAKSMGLGGTASISMVLNGKRNPGPHLVKKLSDHFAFDPRRQEYFENLVKLHRFKRDPEITRLVRQEISGRHPDKSFHFLSEQVFAAISNWYYLAIREMTLLPDFQEDPQWIAEKLGMKISYAQARLALQTLLDLKLLNRDDAGHLIPTQNTIEAGGVCANAAVRNYHLQLLDLAQKSLRTVPFEKRVSAALVLNVRSANVSKVHKLFADFQDQLSELTEDPQGDATYQFCVQFFPLTER